MSATWPEPRARSRSAVRVRIERPEQYGARSGQPGHPGCPQWRQRARLQPDSISGCRRAHPARFSCSGLGSGILNTSTANSIIIGDGGSGVFAVQAGGSVRSAGQSRSRRQRLPVRSSTPAERWRCRAAVRRCTGGGPLYVGWLGPFRSTRRPASIWALSGTRIAGAIDVEIRSCAVRRGPGEGGNRQQRGDPGFEQRHPGQFGLAASWRSRGR